MRNSMTSATASKLPDGSSWERLDAAFRKALTVSKEALLKAEEKEKQEKKAKKRAKKSS